MASNLDWLQVAQAAREHALDEAARCEKGSRDFNMLLALYHHLDAFICDNLCIPDDARVTREMRAEYVERARA